MDVKKHLLSLSIFELAIWFAILMLQTKQLLFITANLSSLSYKDMPRQKLNGTKKGQNAGYTLQSCKLLSTSCHLVL